MAKGQKRSNREIKKPKKTKETSKTPTLSPKGMTASIEVAKKKS